MMYTWLSKLNTCSLCFVRRRFLLEWMSFLHRYVPVGLLEVTPQRLNQRPPLFVGRSDLETLLASDNAVGIPWQHGLMRTAF